MKLNVADHIWLNDPALQRLFTVFAQAGAETRCVGGCVRDTLAGRAVKDIDLAVNVPPGRAESILQQADIVVKRTGFEFGTITAVIQGRGYEITSLRRDVQTDGRRAVVTYTKDWKEDSLRRDLTINALYLAADGTISDFYDGVADLQAGRVRFIGDPAQRIAEDYLRILRFFRFQAAFGRGVPDAAALAACAAAADKQTILSVERVWSEFKKLLAVADPCAVLELMRIVLQPLLPELQPLDRLQALVSLQQKTSDISVLTRFITLLPRDKKMVAAVAQRWKLSVAESDRLQELVTPLAVDWGDIKARRRALFLYGRDVCLQWILLMGAAEHYTPVKNTEIPVRPFTGDDLRLLGYAQGVALGDALRTLTDWWLSHDPLPDRAACLAEAKQIKKP